MALNSKQHKFIENLMEGMSQKDAYIEAGYKARGNAAETNAARLLRNDQVQAELKIQRKKAAYRAEVSAARTLKEEMCIAFSDFRRLFQGETLVPPDQLPEEVARAIKNFNIDEKNYVDKNGRSVKEVVCKVTFWDKGRALERISRHLGIYKAENKHEVEHKGNIETKLVNFPPQPESVAEWEEQYRKYAEKNNAKDTPDSDRD